MTAQNSAQTTPKAAPIGAAAPSTLNFSKEAPEGSIIKGFYDPDPELTGRWIGKEAFVVLQVPPQAGQKSTSAFIRLSGMNFRPDHYSIVLKAGDDIVGELENPQEGTSFALWSKPLDLVPGEMLKIAVEVSSIYRPADHGEADERLLGAMIEEISILPARSRSFVNFSRPSEYLDVPISGMYAPEPGLPGRWTGAEMGVYLERPGGTGDNFQVILHGVNYRSDSFQLGLEVNGKHISDNRSSGQGESFMIVSNCAIPEKFPLVKLKIIIDPVYQPWKHGSNDHRELGAFLESIELRRATYPGCADFTKPDVDLVAIEGVFPEEEGLDGIGRWIGPEAVLKIRVPSEERVFSSLILEGTNYRIDTFNLSAEINGQQIYSFQPSGGNFSVRTPIIRELKTGSIAEVRVKVRPAFNSKESGGKERVLGVVLRRVCIE